MRAVNHKKKPASDFFLDIFKVLFLALVVIICVYPFWNIFIVSINDATDAMRGGLYFLPRKLSFASYKDILTRSTFLHSILVTLARTLVGTPLAVLVTTALAYVLSRKEMLWKKPITLIFIFTMYFGGGLVPYYMVLKNLGMLDHFIVYIFPNLVSVYNMILVRNYIEGMPDAIFESAKIDGANDLVIFFRMILPLSKPIIMTIALFVAIMHWNSWFDGIILMNKPTQYPLQSYLQTIIIQGDTSVNSTTDWQTMALISDRTVKCAQIFLSTLPIVAAYPFLQRYFVKGMVMGSVKG